MNSNSEKLPTANSDQGLNTVKSIPIEKVSDAMDCLEIVRTAHAGRGLKATKYIPAGSILFIAPTIRVPRDQYIDHCQHTVFEDYLFVGKSGDLHLALAWGSIFNHSATPNVLWQLNERDGVDEITYTAFRPLLAGDDACISYGKWGEQFEPKEEDKEKEEEERNYGGCGYRSTDINRDDEESDERKQGQSEGGHEHEEDGYLSMLYL